MTESIQNTNFYPNKPKLPPTEASKVYHQPSVDQETIRLLIVDDYAILREGLASLLANISDIEVVGQCNDTRTGIYMAEKLQPSVILSDISMPGTSPFELARRSKILNPAIKIIFFVKEVSDSNIEQGLDTGACGFITKTEPISGIMNAIRTVSSGSKFFSEEIKDRIVTRRSYDSQYGSYTPRRNLLSPREIEVLCCVARGMKAKSIGNIFQRL